MYEVLLKQSARKELERLPRPDQQKVIAVLESLESQPLRGKKLKGKFSGAYSIRAWPYRIIYELRQQKLLVLVISISHRKDAYK